MLSALTKLTAKVTHMPMHASRGGMQEAIKPHGAPGTHAPLP